MICLLPMITTTVVLNILSQQPSFVVDDALHCIRLYKSDVLILDGLAVKSCSSS